jgi:hypothetical protein
MIGVWVISNTGEVMRVHVVSGFKEFEDLINSHPKMQFLAWESPLQS